MITRLLALLLLAATALAAAGPQAPALPLLLPAPDAADWEALAGAALVALYVARRRAHLRAG